MKSRKGIYKRVGWEEIDIPAECPWCGSRDLVKYDIEFAKCQKCGHKTDIYEAMKQAER